MTLDKEIPDAQFFRVDGGAVLPSALALRAYLRTISQKEFDAHVTPQKNDYANWVEEVLGEKEIAKRLRMCMTREQMVWVLDDAFAEERMDKVVKGKVVERKKDKVAPGQPPFADPVSLEDDVAFTEKTKEITSTNENINKKYEEIAKNMQEAIRDVMPEDLEKMREQLKNRYSELMAKISEARRSGKDMLIPALVMRNFMPKLSLAIATKEKKDFEVAKVILDEGEFELKVALDQTDVNIKKEVMALAENAK